MDQGQSPLFIKTYDFLRWLMPHTGRFPKQERFRLAKRLDDAAFDFFEYIVSTTRTNNIDILRLADIELQKVRFYLRLSHDCSYISRDQYHFAATQIVELGNLLGGWMKKMSTPKGGVG